MSVAGVLLAAGAGRRMGTPKALLRDQAGVAYLDRAIGTLLEGGCARVVVVLGASSGDARTLLEQDGWLGDDAVAVVDAADWDTGMGASLRAGLAALRGAPAEVVAAVVTLVDLPDVTAAVVRRLVAGEVQRDTLARASYGGHGGHPVVLGRDHWAGVTETATGDRGARDYLASQAVRAVECGDLATGRDVDRPSDLGRPANGGHGT